MVNKPVTILINILLLFLLLIMGVSLISGCQRHEVPPEKQVYRTSDINLKLGLIENDDMFEKFKELDASKRYSRRELAPYSTEIIIQAKILDINSEDPNADRIVTGDIVNISLDTSRLFIRCDDPSDERGVRNVSLDDPICKFDEEAFDSSKLVNLQKGDLFELTATLISFDKSFKEFKIYGDIESLQ